MRHDCLDLRGGRVATQLEGYGTVLLSGIVGSTAYGLAGPDSDVDRLGMFAAPAWELLGLSAPAQSRVTTKPDATFHEAGKAARLILAGNPTAAELLWLPEDLYEARTPLGDEAIALRSSFLSAKRTRDAYLGYATQQFKKLLARADDAPSGKARHRAAKHARHLMRTCPPSPRSAPQ
jgi:predicted nucleotidyltransferase